LRLPATGPVQKHWIMAYSFWALMNVLLLLSVLALMHEAQQVLRLRLQKRRVKAMIRLPLGRTLACETLNFPAKELILESPIPSTLKADSTAEISFFLPHRSFNLSGHVQSVDGLTTKIAIHPGSLAEFLALKDAVLARGKDWPGWLPARGADRPLPEWFYRAIEALPAKLIDLMTKLAALFSWETLSKLWKQEK
jgi:cellulose synthase (UDP-forming)